MPAGNGWSRRTFLRGGLVAGGALAVPGLLSGCEAVGFGDTLERIRSDGVVRVGHAGEVPYAYDENGLRGAMPAVVREVFGRIDDGIKVEGVQTLFKDLVKALNAGSFDLVVAGMFVQADRCERAAFSDPVYCARTALLARKGNPKDLSDYRSLARTKARLAVLGGAVEQDDAEAAGVADDRIELVGSQQRGLELVADGKVDAFALTSISLRALLADARKEAAGEPPPEGTPTPRELADRVELLPPFTPTVDGKEKLGCGAIAFRKPDEGLRTAFNRELAAVRREGKLLELTTEYGFTEDDMPPEGVTTEELCRTGGTPGGGYEPPPR